MPFKIETKFGPGDTVRFKNMDVLFEKHTRATILSVAVDGGGVPAYAVSWFIHGTRHGSGQVQEFELEAVDVEG
jgi:hypothetical protein